MVGLSEVVLNIIVLCRNPQLDKLLLECSTLLKEAMNFSVYYHRIKIKGRSNVLHHPCRSELLLWIE